MSHGETATLRPVRLHRAGKHTLDRDHDVCWCGTCGARWCDVCHPTPSARCPFEYDHDRLLGPGVLAYYDAIHGRVKVKVRHIVPKVGGWEVECVVTSRTDRVYDKGDLIWTSPTWLTSRDGWRFVADD